MKPSAGVSKTMSASLRPLCGRAPSGSFPTFTSSAGWRGTTPPGAGRSVSGQRFGATGGATALGFDFGFGDLPDGTTTSATTAPTRTRNAATITVRRLRFHCRREREAWEGRLSVRFSPVGTLDKVLAGSGVLSACRHEPLQHITVLSRWQSNWHRQESNRKCRDFCVRELAHCPETDP